MDNFLSVYKKDYIPKKVPEKIHYGEQQEFRDPMGESFKQFLTLEPNNLDPSQEHYEEYLKKVKDQYPILSKKYFSDPVDEKLVTRNFNLGKQTIYQSDYCDMEKRWDEVREAQLKAKEISLPDDWVIPLTTTALVYRNPTILQNDALKRRPPVIPPPASIGMSKKIQDILHIKTGNSEYGGVIGELGKIIVEDQIHGKIIHPPCGCAKHARLGK